MFKIRKIEKFLIYFFEKLTDIYKFKFYKETIPIIKKYLNFTTVQHNPIP